jgi:hypothetical protein
MRGRVQTVAMKQALEDVAMGMSMAQAARLHGVTVGGIGSALKRGSASYRVPIICPKCQHAHVVQIARVNDIYGFKQVEPPIPKDSPLYERLKT